MNTLSYKTKSANAQTIEREWFVIDLENEVVGRAASRIASVLRGKHKPTYTPHFDAGDHVIVINADKVRFTGAKLTDKLYIRHTGYPGGQRFATPRDLLGRRPIAVIESAIRGMLPKNSLGRAMFRKLHVYPGPEHPHAAQKPQEFNF